VSIERDVKNAAENVGDRIDEAGHRTAATFEKESREEAGDDMTLGEKVKSMASEAKHSLEAGIDKMKRAGRGDD